MSGVFGQKNPKAAWHPDGPAVSECVRSVVDFQSSRGPRFVDAGRSPCFSFLIFSSQVLSEPRPSPEGVFFFSHPATSFRPPHLFLSDQTYPDSPHSAPPVKNVTFQL